MVPLASGRLMVRLAVRVVVFRVLPKLSVVPSAKVRVPWVTVPEPAMRPRVSWPPAPKLDRAVPLEFWNCSRSPVWLAAP